MKHAQVEREKNQDAENETRPVPWCDLNQRHHGWELRIILFAMLIVILILTRKRFRLRLSVPITKKNQTFADGVFCSVTCDAPMFGRSPLCHHNTIALAI